MEIKWLKCVRSKAAQIYDYGPEFCFISKNNEQCHPFVLCKDFLQDVVQGTINKRIANIYEFNFDPKKRPAVDLEFTRLAFTDDSDDKLKEKIPNVLDFINQAASKLKLKKTTVQEVSNPPKRYSKTGIFVFEGSPRWMNSPPLLSMYSLFIRASTNHKIGTDLMVSIKDIIKNRLDVGQRDDSNQLKQALPGIENIFNLGYRKFFFMDSNKNYPAHVDIDTMHENCGIVGFSNEHSKEAVPFWHRKKVKELLKKAA